MGKREIIFDTLRSRIAAEHEPDAHLGSLQAICKEFGVSTGTAVAAMADLQAAGYVYSTQRGGYFMAQTLPSAKPADEQRAVVAALRDEARRLQEMADRLDRTLQM
ncbi:GntR family transcriptional regulator [Brachybacterium sacelli]|uniref:DNA-binding GntR family transcriptional regulator n=1 Tax=Brachybacterium sacelli TaxID=173364 RepID=A0ABS4X810_9MICO|nr:GntR family transcriptional regulator [Brachybacterium sacelli]MBP2383844.1 DNA-binding GntR family transcriptional regulator [Brachybacterium sacelli]